jgi:type II secretory pathway component PulM
MKALRSLFASLPRLSDRERRVVLAGGLISAAALAFVGIVRPVAHRWSARQVAYAASVEQWTRLVTLSAEATRLRGALAGQGGAPGYEGELLTGATPALAGSNLQGLVQRYAAEAAVELDRVDAAVAPGLEKQGLVGIPILIQARGDIFGLSALLRRIEEGEKLLLVDEMTVNGNAEGVLSQGSGTPLALSWTVKLHGLYAMVGHENL